ncbi:metallophosphoesterase [Desulfoscipio gibsoniae]|uniref:Putative phosphohydrolase n=1 Tax=Desulfoscipio gibsoniae DSM 7213 TaxID=767817 RepID=R4KGJ9_9FIRM|nr:metallophosphoesterase [Desulfoscipio gibsoniae]AGL00787.1 putative phosphohydrolase [Desulfoscipio gibsoniae DSM 7213]
MSIQEVLQWMLKLAVIGLLLIGLLVVDIYFEVNYPKVNRVTVNSEKIPPGAKINILQISDFHNWQPNDHHQNLLREIRQLNPDLIVITGDFIDRKTDNLNNVYSLVEELVQINPYTFFVCGNHEWANKNKKSFLSGLSNRGVRVINNEHAVWFNNQLTINICGVDDPSKGRADLDKAINGINTELFTLLLAHAPAIIEKEAITRADLVLCGHTHGGQIRLPFVGAIIAPGQGLFPTYDKGIYNIDRNTTLYIDSGLGTGVLPIRFLNRSQISFITVTGK